MTIDLRTSRRARSRRAVVNDRILIEGARALTVEVGWDAVNLHAVAKRVGMTSRAMDDRFESRSALGVAVWSDGPGAAVMSAMSDLVSALVPDISGPGQDLPAAIAIVNRLQRPDEMLTAGLEILCAAAFDGLLREAMAIDLAHTLGGRLLVEPAGSRQERIKAAQAAYVAVTAFGLLLACRRPGAASVNLAPLVGNIASALTNPSKPSDLPEIDSPQMELKFEAPAADAYEALLRGTLVEIADHGYAASTLARIVAAVGVTQGLVYARHKNKLELFMAATAWRHESAIQKNADVFAELAHRLGPGRADAVLWREYMRPEHQRGRNLGLEQLRVGWREPVLRDATDAAEKVFTEGCIAANPGQDSDVIVSRVHLDFAQGYGAMLLPTFAPLAWSLPFDVVTVPLLGGPRREGTMGPMHPGKGREPEAT